MIIESIQIGLPESRLDEGREWTTGFYKQSIEGSVQVGALGLEGDGQADLKNHGGRDKAICVYPEIHYEDWRSELDLPMGPGAFGENFTIAGLTELEVCIGDVFEADELRVEVSQPRQPCWKLGQRWNTKTLPRLTIDTGRTGWYFRVLKPGAVSPGTRFSLLERRHPEWTIHSANSVYYGRKIDPAATAELASCPALAQSWRKVLS